MADKYKSTYTGETVLTAQQVMAEDMLREIEIERKTKGAGKENLLTVLAHPLDPSKPDREFKNVFDICHNYGNDGPDGTFHQALRLLMIEECDCLTHYMVRCKTKCKKDHKAIREYISLNEYTVEIAMQKGERGNG